ncbi:MAG: NACHT domain-containing protein [Candidatus Competibacteraceae bacterium]
MTSNLPQKLQELKQLLDGGLLTPAEFERERETLLAAWRAAPAPSAPSAPAVSIDLDALPTVIALPLREYRDETNPVLKLWYACDGVEMLLRLVVMMGLGVLSQRGPLTPELRKRLQEYRLEEPTLGNWRALAEAVVEALGDAPDPLPELPGLVRATLAPLLRGPVEKNNRDESNSFIRLRNRLAHGGGISRALAQSYVEIWQPRLRALWEQLAWLAQVELVAQDGQGGYGVLRGPNPQAQPYTPRDPAVLAQAFAAGDAVVLARDEVLLPLWPLALYGPPRSPNPDAPPADEIVPQVYLRRGEVRLQYTPLGALAAGLSESEASALERFLDWFKVAEEPRARRGRFQIRDFTDEMRKDGLRLLGRDNECAILKNAVAERTEGVIWVSGKAGIGKSYLFAWLALRLLDEPPPDTLVLPYRFRAGDERCSREAFLRFAVERLAAWLEVEVEADSTPWLKRLRGLLEKLAGRRVVFLLDGLDEIAARDARFAQEVPLALTGPGILWVCAGRPDYDLSVVFAAAGAFQPFPAPDGLPGMDAGDIRTLLLERIGPLRKHLLRHDQEQGECIGNPFVEKVARAAADLPLYVKEKVAQAAVGVPLYVKYVIDDIFAGRYRVLDGHERLPPSLSAYYEELLRRLSVGDLHQVLTPLAATLAVALEPLDTEALAALLYRRGKLVPEGEAGLRLVERGLSAIASMLKRAPTPDGQDGYTLYHLSLRQHMTTSEHSRAAVATAREVLGDLALDVAPDTAAPYLYRCGIIHLLETRRAEKALGLLTWFEYVMDRLRTLTDPEGVKGLGEDWRATLRHVGPLDREQHLWQAFWREREHILRRGDERWSAYKILLQLAVEHADDSPVTRQAEAWLEAGHCDWVWLRNPQRIKYAAPNPCLRVFEGHTDLVSGAIELEDGRILSWSWDETLRLWDICSGMELAVLIGQNGSTRLKDGQILSWSRDDKTLRLWDAESGAEWALLEGYTNALDGKLELRDGSILSWSLDLLRLLNGISDNELSVLAGHIGIVKDAIVLKSGHVLSWSWDDKTLRLWDAESGAEWALLEGHTGAVEGALELRDGRILSWSWDDKTLRLWDAESGSELAVLAGHYDGVGGAITLVDERILSWSDRTLRLWDSSNGAELFILYSSHSQKSIAGAIELACGRILSWTGGLYRVRNISGNGLVVPVDMHLADGETLHIWERTSEIELAVLVGHSEAIMGAAELADGQILSWSADGTSRLWNGATGDEIDFIQQANMPWLAVDWLIIQQMIINNRLIYNDCVGWDIIKMTGIANRKGIFSKIPVWHGDSATSARALLQDGTLVVTLASGHVFCLKLHHGARRITLAEWEAMLAKTDRAPCETQSNAIPAS